MTPRPEILAAAATLLQLPPDRLHRAIELATAPDPDTGPLLSPAEAARRFGVCKLTILRMIRDGRLPAKRVGSQWRIAPAALR